MAFLPLRRRVHDRPCPLLGRFGEDPDESLVEGTEIATEVGVAEGRGQVVEGDGGGRGILGIQTGGERAGEEDLQEFGHVVAVWEGSQ